MVNVRRNISYRYQNHIIKTKIVTQCCLVAIVILGVFRLYVGNNEDHYNDYDNDKNDLASKCWIKQAIHSGDIKLFSHRSYFDNTERKKPTCHESLSSLASIGVNHLDLDLVLAEHKENESDLHWHKIVVAHPMEFKQQSDYYSPCANTDFDDMIHALRDVYEDDFFISMEPKAAWKSTQDELNDVALVNSPSSILEMLLIKIVALSLEGKCAIIVPDLNNKQLVVQDDNELQKEHSIVNEITKYCQLFTGIRLSDDPPTSLGENDLIMPTIEFHPSHPHNTNGKIIPDSLWRKCIFWIVDTEEDLLRATRDMKPFGIVSNTPKHLVDIIDEPSWCR